MHHPEIEELRRRPRLPARLVYDTADYPLPPGVRRRDVTSRHLLYQAEALCLDLRLEREPASRRTTLVGQLADSREPLRPLGGAPVVVLTGDRVLARAVSNPMGEFQLEYEAGERVSLCVCAEGDRMIELTVDRRLGKRS